MMGNEPREDEMPIDINSLNSDIQLALEIYEYLPDRWEGMNAAYLGKDYSLVPFLFQEYKVEGPLRMHLLWVLRIIDREISKSISDKQAVSRAASERQAKAGAH
jgi:hypothetical protein